MAQDKYNKKDYVTQIPNKGKPWEYAIAGQRFTSGKIRTFPGPGQTPEAIKTKVPPTQWLKPNTYLKLPQVVIISIMPDWTLLCDELDIRTDYQGPWWGYPFSNDMQPNKVAYPHGFYGIGEAFDGPGVPGYSNLNPQLVYFPEMFDVTIDRDTWPHTPKVVPSRYKLGIVQMPELATYLSLIEAANAAKKIIEAARPQRTFVTVAPWIPQGYSYLTTNYTDQQPVWKLNPHGNVNGPGKWPDAYSAVQLGEFGHIQAPTTDWREAEKPDSYDLKYVDWTDPNNQGYNFQGPTELLFPFPLNDFAEGHAFVGCDVYHIYIGYRAFFNGPNLINNHAGILKPYEMESLFYRGDINEVAAASVDGFDQNAVGNYMDYINNAIQCQKMYPRHQTDIYAFPQSDWGTPFNPIDVRNFEQFYYWFGGTLVNGLNPNLYQPSIFNAGQPDYTIEGVYNLIKTEENIIVPFWYPIEQRKPPMTTYIVADGHYGSRNLLQMLSDSMTKMNTYLSSTRTDYGAAFWTATSSKWLTQWKKINVNYKGQASVAQMSGSGLANIIANHYNFSLTGR